MTICLPGDRAAGAEQDGSAHAPDFEKGKKNSRADGVADLGTPTGISIGGQSMVVLGGWRDCVLVSFGVGAVRKGHVSM